MQTTAISCHNVSYETKGKYLVKDANFSIAPGQKVAILGHNGAGKSTLIDILAQALKPQQGSLQFFDAPFSQLDRKRLGIVFDSLYAFPLLKVKEIIAYFMAIYGIRASADLDQKIDALELRKHWDKTLTQLSKGERKKVWLALTTMHDPEILIMDEATSELDPFSKNHCWEKVILSRPDRTVLFTTHSWEEAQQYADAILFMSNGVIPMEPVATSRLLSPEFLPYSQKVVVQSEPQITAYLERSNPQHYCEDRQLHILAEDVDQLVNNIRQLTPSYSVVNTTLMDVYALFTKKIAL
jgi:ABC-2 type transport system ATP-binding protein